MFKKFTGEYYNTLDEKGRIAFPAKLRTNIQGDTVWINKGLDNEKCLVIYTPEAWDAALEDLEEKLNIYKQKSRMVLRKFVAPARQATIDKNGRIAIPQNLRDYAGLKKNCIFTGVTKIIEIWDVDIYHKVVENSENVGVGDLI